MNQVNMPDIWMLIKGQLTFLKDSTESFKLGVNRNKLKVGVKIYLYM